MPLLRSMFRDMHQESILCSFPTWTSEKDGAGMQEIQALLTCHQEHPYAKFWGVCNEQKWALDRCFREEKAIKRLDTFLLRGKPA